VWLPDEVVVERHEEELGDGVLHLVARKLTEADDGTRLEELLEVGLFCVGCEEAEVEDRRESAPRRGSLALSSTSSCWTMSNGGKALPAGSGPGRSEIPASS
jgi:hypothetical protein